MFNSGSLFSDLPATKAEVLVATSTGNSASVSDDATTQKKYDDNNSIQSSQPNENVVGSIISTPSNATTTSSIVRNLGTAGTSMAFVPAAARRRQQQQKSKPIPKTKPIISSNNNQKSQNNIDESTSTTTPPTTVNISQSQLIQEEKQYEIHENNTLSIDDTLQHGLKRKLQESDDTNVKVQTNSSSDSEQIDKTNETKNNYNYNVKDNYSYSNTSNIDITYDHNNSSTISEKEQRLLEQVEQDPYDPMVPNDLLHYWDYKNRIRHLEDIERERLATIESQKAVFETIQKEQNEITYNYKNNSLGNVIQDQQIQNSSTSVTTSISSTTTASSSDGGVGRGRGRGGLSNLPAWMIQKMKEKEELTPTKPTPSENNIQLQDDGQFDEC